MQPTVTLEKLVDVTSMPEPGGDFHFTLKITNTSVEPVVITQLWDDQMTDPDLVAYLGTFLGRELAPGAFIKIPYVINHTDAMTYGNTATVWVQDNEENTATAEATQMVEVIDVPPTVTLDKSVDAQRRCPNRAACSTSS